jgi:tetratricopeptide (TPR) repeat protein
MKSVLLALLLATRSLAPLPGDEHLLVGADHFRAARFELALVEFQVARKLGADPSALWYVAATLEKLKRPEEAVEAFAEAKRVAPEAGDALLDYYRALAFYDARLFLLADQVLARLGAQPGPKVAGQAQKVRGDIAGLFSAEPSTTAIDWYLTQGQAALGARRPALAEAYALEAQLLSDRRQAPYRREDAAQVLASARQAGSAP